MKKFIVLLILLALGMAFVVPGLQAARYDREPGEPGYVNVVSTSLDKALVTAPCYIYGVTIYPTTSAGIILIYDNASAATGMVKIEIGESAQYDTRRYSFDPPLKMNYGAYADVSNGSVVLEYR